MILKNSEHCGILHTEVTSLLQDLSNTEHTIALSSIFTIHNHGTATICILVEATFSTALAGVKMTFSSVVERVEIIIENAASTLAQTIAAILNSRTDRQIS